MASSLKLLTKLSQQPQIRSAVRSTAVFPTVCPTVAFPIVRSAVAFPAVRLFSTNKAPNDEEETEGERCLIPFEHRETRNEMYYRFVIPKIDDPKLPTIANPMTVVVKPSTNVLIVKAGTPEDVESNYMVMKYSVFDGFKRPSIAGTLGRIKLREDAKAYNFDEMKVSEMKDGVMEVVVPKAEEEVRSDVIHVQID